MLLQSLSPEEKILNRIVVSASAAALHALFDTHGSTPYKKLLERHPPRTISLGVPIKRGNVALLRAFHDAGFDMKFYADKMLSHAARLRQEDYLLLVRHDVGSNLRLLDVAQPGHILDEPWPLIQGEIEIELRDILSDPGNITRDSMLRGFDHTHVFTRSLRSLAICIHLIPNLAEALDGWKFHQSTPD